MALPLALLINMTNINHMADPEVMAAEINEMMMEEMHFAIKKFVLKEREASVPKKSTLGDLDDRSSRE